MMPSRCISYPLELPSVDDRAQPTESPCLALGMAVLYRAWIDALDGIDYREAGCGSREWWTRPSRALYRWCAALGLEVSWVVARARRRLREYDRGDQETRTRIRGHAEYWDRDADDDEAEDIATAPDGARRTPQASRQRAYYLRNREHLLAERKRKRAAREAAHRSEASVRMEARYPGYTERHAFLRRKVKQDEIPCDSAPVQDAK